MSEATKKEYAKGHFSISEKNEAGQNTNISLSVKDGAISALVRAVDENNGKVIFFALEGGKGGKLELSSLDSKNSIIQDMEKNKEGYVINKAPLNDQFKLDLSSDGAAKTPLPIDAWVKIKNTEDKTKSFLSLGLAFQKETEFSENLKNALSGKNDKGEIYPVGGVVGFNLYDENDGANTQAAIKNTVNVFAYNLGEAIGFKPKLEQLCKSLGRFVKDIDNKPTTDEQAPSSTKASSSPAPF